MCTDPQTANGRTFPCRVCDECVSGDRIGWLCRAMYERASSRYTFSITLTYSEETEESRQAARMFEYRHIKLLLKKLRREAEYKFGRGCGAIRFMVAGEQGTRNGRCHWHLILFSDFDVMALGGFTTLCGVPRYDRADVVSLPGRGRSVIQLRWSKWPYGIVAVQEPDEGGISYAVTYALKERFAADRSRGTLRESRSEVFSAGLFRMSKRPAIGWRYFEALAQRWVSEGFCPPQMAFRVPDSKYTYYPKGLLRERLLVLLREANARYHARVGRDFPQWSSLRASVYRPEPGGERERDILDGKEAEQREQFGADEAREIAARTAYQAREYDYRRIARQCGSTVACGVCLNSAEAGDLERLGIAVLRREPGYTAYHFKDGDPKGARLRQCQKDGAGSGINPLCKCANQRLQKETFLSSNAPVSARKNEFASNSARAGGVGKKGWQKKRGADRQ